jgi:hypothetical protein
MVEEGTYKPKDGRISLTAISQRAMANYNSAKSWAERRGYTELLSGTYFKSICSIAPIPHDNGLQTARRE